MAAYFLQMKPLHLFFSLLMSVLLTACISTQPYPKGEVQTQPITIPVVRAPKIGQEWVYQVRNVFNQEIVDTVTERVVSVGNEIRISRSGTKAGVLPDEIQSPWGYVVQDPHWKPAQLFSKPIPLWPTQLQVGWQAFFSTQYKVPSHPDGSYYWGVEMSASQWERVKTPAGEFLVLKFHNEIPNFVSNDLFRIGNERQEDLWFSPEVGRWVIRRSSGRYIMPGVYWANAFWEDFLEWQLISWK